MVIEKNIGRNIKLFREAQGLTQDQVADFLGVKRPMISYYENGERDIAMSQLEKLADLFGVEISALIEEDPGSIRSELAFAFRANGLSTLDIIGIADFKKVVKNYLRMQQIKNEA